MPDERTTNLIRQGQQAMRQGDRHMASDYFRAATDLDPTNVTAWLWLSGAEDDPAAARRALERVLELEPDNQRAIQGLQEIEAHLAELSPEWGEADWEEEDDWELSGGSEITRQSEGPLTIEQELRAALRVDDEMSRGGGTAYIIEGDEETEDRRPVLSRFRAGAGEGDLAYRVAVAVLTMTLLLGMVCLVLVWLGAGPFVPRV
jgi:tetratricopeptide (TPR) repeat protein